VRFKSRIVQGVAAVVLITGAVAAGAGSAAADPGNWGGYGRALVVSNQNVQSASAHNHGNGGGCGNAQFSTIGAAVAAAHPGDTILVCPGTYSEEVLVNTAVSLVGRDATINASGLSNGIVITSSNVAVKGFTVTGALGEGILAEPPGTAALPFPLTDPSQALQPITGLTIENNVVNANDQGGDPVTHQCVATGLYPGDCGGGIHINTVAHSFVENNVVTNNDDGILITDDVGPNYGNVVANNYVAHNIYECGIVLPSHNQFAVAYTQNPDSTYTTGALTPKTGGIYGNLVIGNMSIDNGSFVVPHYGGSGSGIGIFAPSAGSASYNNTVANNYITGSGQSGFTIHAHYTGGEYVSGNRVVGNGFGKNNIGGDGLDGPSTDPDFATTAILVFSAVHVDMVIAGNHIHGNQIGIWLSASVNAAGLASNSISGATTNVYVSLTPVAFTGPAIATTSPTATVGVAINPNGLSTQYYVEYGTTTSYTSVSATASAGSGIGPEGLAVTLAGPLASGTTYHYQVVATNSSGTTSGGDQTFTES